MQNLHTTYTQAPTKCLIPIFIYPNMVDHKNKHHLVRATCLGFRILLFFLYKISACEKNRFCIGRRFAYKGERLVDFCSAFDNSSIKSKCHLLHSQDIPPPTRNTQGFLPISPRVPQTSFLLGRATAHINPQVTLQIAFALPLNFLGYSRQKLEKPGFTWG